MQIFPENIHTNYFLHFKYVSFNSVFNVHCPCSKYCSLTKNNSFHIENLIKISNYKFYILNRKHPLTHLLIHFCSVRKS